ncbi:MAG TPA: NUDIX domain-containing protein [Aggregatilineales bacterium]|jgi:8-oxo-dGTP pyrophosphatase MutT (NUDIX family)|nr:NUDIX domain-containing protein [Aggregatilineales bacterium]
MMTFFANPETVIKRVRAILLTGTKSVMFIKRVKPNTPPYWVAPGGGVEDQDKTLLDTLYRELHEELGARVEVIQTAFVLEHQMGGKQLEEHFFICRLVDYDLTLREGPEFKDPKRGEYIPDEIPLLASELSNIHIKTPELADWLLQNLQVLRGI